MREIKFRAWDGRKYVIYQIVEKDGTLYDADFGKQMEVQQFTGLYDKNGKEIYEGDVLGNDAGAPNQPVEFSRGSFCLNGLEPLIGQKADWTRFLEVIGNIYENSELLK